MVNLFGMKVKLKYDPVTDSIMKEETLLDMGSMEMIYALRKLKALAESQEKGSVEVLDDLNGHGQAYSVIHKIWLDKDEFEKL